MIRTTSLIGGVACAVSLLTGAAVLEDTVNAPLYAPSLQDQKGMQLFQDSQVTPSWSPQGLVTVPGTHDKRVQDLLRIARYELSLTPQQARKRSAASRRTSGGALLTLGLLFYHGYQVPLDLDRARELFVRARILGNETVLIPLAWCYLDGCGKTPNLAAFKKVLPGLRRLSKKRAHYFQYELARREAKEGEELSPEARKWLVRAATQGDRYALNEVGIRAVADDDFPKAIAAFGKAAKQGSSAAKNNERLAQTLLLERAGTKSEASFIGSDLHGQGIDRSNTTHGSNPFAQPIGPIGADTLYAKARQQHKSATSAADFARTIELYRQASAQGQEQARIMLSLILSRPLASGGIDPVWMRQTSLIDPRQSGATKISVSGRLFERDVSPLIDLVPEAFVDAEPGSEPALKKSQ